MIHMCTNKRFRRQPTYTLHGHTLEAVDTANCLGVTLSEDLSWTPHVDNTAAKASKILGFLRRNMFHCTNRVRERTYNALVLPVLNYASAAWDPYLTRDIDSLEKFQRIGARYVCNNYWDRTPGCVTGMIRDLGWQSLQERKEDHRLIILYKIHNNLLDIDPEPILKRGDTRTRGRSRLQQSAGTSTVILSTNNTPVESTSCLCHRCHKSRRVQGCSCQPQSIALKDSVISHSPVHSFNLHTDVFLLLLFLTWKHDGFFIPQLGQLLQSSKTPDLISEDEDDSLTSCSVTMRTVQLTKYSEPLQKLEASVV